MESCVALSVARKRVLQVRARHALICASCFGDYSHWSDPMRFPIQPNKLLHTGARQRKRTITNTGWQRMPPTGTAAKQIITSTSRRLKRSTPSAPLDPSNPPATRAERQRCLVRPSSDAAASHATRAVGGDESH